MGPKYTVLALLGLCANQALAQLPLRFVSFNIRYDNGDISLGDAEKWWLTLDCGDDPTQCRASGVMQTLNNASTSGRDTVIGLQEVLDTQLTDILGNLGSSWAHVGVARDDGDKEGEYNPILYRSDVFNLVYSETKWLSETPDTPSKSWSSGSNRIVTTAVLEHAATGRRLLHANTHLDNASPEARANQIGVAVDLIRAVDAAQGGPGLPVTLTGDFNAGESDAAYTGLVADKYVADLYGLATAAQRTGETATYTGFANEFSSRIDYVWVGPEENAVSSYAVNGYQVLGNLVNGVMCSDHRAVVGDLTLG